MNSSAVYTLASSEMLIFAFAAMIVGMIMLIKGGDWTVDAAVTVAERFGLPAMVIGFTIVAIGTSLPELIVSVNANLSGFPGLSIGNVVGSNIANSLLVLGTAAVITPLIFKGRGVVEDAIFMLIASGALLYLTYLGFISKTMGGFLIAVLIGYIIYKIKTEKNLPDEEITPEVHDKNTSLLVASGILLAGLISVSLGSEFLVRGAVRVAEMANVPDAIIGLTLVALGTSLPELSVAIQAARKNETEIVVSNVIGSNVFNILSILGITAMIKELPIDTIVIEPDALFMMAVTVVLALFAFIFKKAGRLSGLLMLAVYFSFIAYRYITS